MLFLTGLEKETCLIPALSEQEPQFANSYNLVTENLVLTQYTLHLGFHRYLLSVPLGLFSTHVQLCTFQ